MYVRLFYVDLFLCVTTGACVIHVWRSEDSPGMLVFATNCVWHGAFLFHVVYSENLSYELQESLVSACHLTIEVDGTLYVFEDSELNPSRALPFPEIHTWCSKDE